MAALTPSPLHAADESRARPATATEDDIASLIRDLGHPSYETRNRATRLLCTAGMAAYQPLEAAARGDDVETALRARDILATLNRLMFGGVALSLEVSETRIPWDNPVQLKLTMINRSSYPARVPFELDPSKRAELSNEARQVADMIDVAEWLVVRAPDGHEVQLRVNDIAMDSEIEHVVTSRVDGGPTSTLAPGQKAEIVVPAFNRGWARYSFLDAGTYTVTFDYVPAWEDPALAKQQAGRVGADPISISVYHAAPSTVSRRGEEASVKVIRRDDVLVAELTNRSDQPLLLNTNFGPAPPFAQGRWVCERGAEMIDVPAAEGKPRSWAEFDESRLVQVAPGATEELARLPIRVLAQRIAGRRNEVQGVHEVYFSYSSLCDRRWQVRQGSLLMGNEDAPRILREPLPPQLHALWQTSNRVALRLGE